MKTTVITFNSLRSISVTALLLLGFCLMGGWVHAEERPNLLGEDPTILRKPTNWLISKDVGWSLDELAGPGGLDVLIYERPTTGSYALAHTAAVAVTAGQKYGFRALVQGRIDSGSGVPTITAVSLRLLDSDKPTGRPEDGILQTIPTQADLSGQDWITVEGEFIPKQDCWARILFHLPQGTTGTVRFAGPAIWEINE